MSAVKKSDRNEPDPDEPDEAEVHAIERLCAQAFGPGSTSIVGLTDVNLGRGAFSVVQRVDLAWHDRTIDQKGMRERPGSVVAKLPVPGPNGRAAIAAGAYRREALAYRELLADGPIATPTAYAVEERTDGSCALLLEDLTGFRSVDQLNGLSLVDAERVAETLALFHRRWRAGPRLSALAVRHNTIAGLATDGLVAGLAGLADSWADDVSDHQRRTLAELVEARPELAGRFEAEAPTLCHGDPRADNLVFDDEGDVVLFDWQQMAVQFGEADLAWLAATSLDTDTRRVADRDLVEAYGGDFDRYRLGLALPGLAVLFLAQRRLPTGRARRLAATSLRRIADAVADLEVVALA